MPDENEKKGGAPTAPPAPRVTTAPPALPAPPTGPEPLATAVSPRNAAELLKKAKDKASIKEDELKLAGAIDTAEDKKRAELEGRDLHFDVETFITEGSISKKNVVLLEGKLVIDMHSLNNRENIIVDELVRDVTGLIDTMSANYDSARELATMAMALTKINNKEFPEVKAMPSARDETEAMNYSKKIVLMNTLLDADAVMVRTISMIYTMLNVADLLPESTRKKSDAPSSPDGSS